MSQKDWQVPQIAVCKRAVAMKADLLALGASNPGAIDLHQASAEGDLAGLVSVTIRGSIRIVASLGADQMGRFILEDRGDDLQEE